MVLPSFLRVAGRAVPRFWRSANDSGEPVAGAWLCWGLRARLYEHLLSLPRPPGQTKSAFLIENDAKLLLKTHSSSGGEFRRLAAGNAVVLSVATTVRLRQLGAQHSPLRRSVGC